MIRFISLALTLSGFFILAGCTEGAFQSKTVLWESDINSDLPVGFSDQKVTVLRQRNSSTEVGPGFNVIPYYDDGSLVFFIGDRNIEISEIKKKSISHSEGFLVWFKEIRDNVYLGRYSTYKDSEFLKTGLFFMYYFDGDYQIVGRIKDKELRNVLINYTVAHSKNPFDDRINPDDKENIIEVMTLEDANTISVFLLENAASLEEKDKLLLEIAE